MNNLGRPATVITKQQRDEIANLLVVNTSIKSIARELNISPYHIRRMMERETFQDLLARKRAAVAKALEVTR